MSTAAQDFITEAKYDEERRIIFCLDKEGGVFCGISGIDVVFKYWEVDLSNADIGHFIAAAISEKIEREKGERE